MNWATSCPHPRRPGAGNIIPAVRTGNLVFLSGTGPGLPEGGLLHVGKLGSALTVEQGYACARQTMLNLLTNLKGEIGDLDNVKRIVKLLCMVNSEPDFGDMPLVANRRVGSIGQPLRGPGTPCPVRRRHGNSARRNADRDRDDRRGCRLATRRLPSAPGNEFSPGPARSKQYSCSVLLVCGRPTSIVLTPPVIPQPQRFDGHYQASLAMMNTPQTPG